MNKQREGCSPKPCSAPDSYSSGALGWGKGSKCVSSTCGCTCLSRTPSTLSPQIHLLDDSSEAAVTGSSGRLGVCPPVPHQAGVSGLPPVLLSCFRQMRAISTGSSPSALTLRALNPSLCLPPRLPLSLSRPCQGVIWLLLGCP